MTFLQTCAGIYRARDAVFGRLPEPQFRILIGLAANGGCSVTSACIASGAPATTGLRAVGELERAGLVERLPVPFDRRTAKLELTDLGRERIAEIARLTGGTND